MRRISHARHRFPPAVIRHAVRLRLRFALSVRDAGDLLAERGIDVSQETVRRRTREFAAAYARQIRERHPRPTGRWHLDEVFIRIRGRIHYLRRAVDDDGEVLEVIVRSRRDRKAALKLLRKRLERQGEPPRVCRRRCQRKRGSVNDLQTPSSSSPSEIVARSNVVT